ncbi:MAG: dimethylsulfonioproprionate lyase family protein [Pseudomonadota bacterium]
MSAIGTLLGAVRQLHQATPSLNGFAPWPDDLSDRQVLPEAVPATTTLGVRSLRGTRDTARVIKALLAAAPHLHWKQSYSEEGVGRDFLDAYGYVELFGPGGHFHSTTLRGYIGYWGPGLTYDWHDHEAEELYFTLAGSASFCAKGMPSQVLRPGQARAHASNEPHLMATMGQPFLTYALWRGAGMAGLPRMTRGPTAKQLSAE